MTTLLVFGIYSLVLVLILIFFMGAHTNETYYDKNKIRLIPVDFKASKKGIPTFWEEIRKAKEEDKEFYEGVLKNDIPNALEEFHDTIQSKLQVLDMMGIKVEVVVKSQDKHYKKLLGRGWLFKKQ